MEVYQSKYLHLAYFAESKLIEMTWLPATVNMSDAEYKKELLNYLEITKELRPLKVIPDTREIQFVIHPELQEWTNQVIFPVGLSINLNQIAFVASQEMISQLSIEQTMEEENGTKFITRYFSNKEEAKAWILSLPQHVKA